MEKLRYCFMASYNIFLKLLMKKLEGTGLTVSQPRILDYLATHDGISQAEIAGAVYLEPAPSRPPYPAWRKTASSSAAAAAKTAARTACTSRTRAAGRSP